MAKGHWSFLHEWVIYDYLLARAEEGTLRFKKVVETGKLMGKPKWVKVEEILPIIGTSFPDIKGIKLKGYDKFRPAEVKFITSSFKYHTAVSHISNFNTFKIDSGFILVASHDYIPTDGLLNSYPSLDIFEIEVEDFIAFCRENFSRLFNRQIKAHTSTRVWLLYQGSNFNKGFRQISPARKSMIWCPTENLTGFDIAPGDRVLFFKTLGIGGMVLQKKFLTEKQIDKRWLLKEIFIAEVKSKIFSRSEYSNFKKTKYENQLWGNDPMQGSNWRWNRVFEFKLIKIISINKSMCELYNDNQSKTFVLKAWEAFCYNKSREISLQDYRNLLEVLV